MKLIYKPILLYIVLFAMLGATLSMAISLFLPNKNFLAKSKINTDTQTNFTLTKAFNMHTKKRVITNTVAKKGSSKEFVLTDFAITAIFISKDEKMVMAKDPKGGVFIYLNGIHKGYKLIEVFPKKAKFKKDINYYWAFLNPKDEKEFKENPTTAVSSTTKSNIRETVAGKMFEEIKFKNDKYFIPKSIINEFSNLRKVFTGIGIQIYNINGAISYKVSRLSGSSLFSKLGIKRGDMIMAVDNQKFKSVSGPLKIFQNIKNVKQISITVKRNGQIKELKYEIY